MENPGGEFGGIEHVEDPGFEGGFDFGFVGDGLGHATEDHHGAEGDDEGDEAHAGDEPEDPLIKPESRPMRMATPTARTAR